MPEMIGTITAFPNSVTISKLHRLQVQQAIRNTNSLYSYRAVLSSTVGLLASFLTHFTQTEILTQTSRTYTMPRRVVVKAVGGYEQLQVGLSQSSNEANCHYCPP